MRAGYICLAKYFGELRKKINPMKVNEELKGISAKKKIKVRSRIQKNSSKYVNGGGFN